MSVQLQLFPTNDHLEKYQRSEKIYEMHLAGCTGAEIAKAFHIKSQNVYRIISDKKGRNEELWKALENAVFELGFDPFIINRAYSRLRRCFRREDCTLETLKNTDLSELADMWAVGNKLLQVYDYIQKH